MRDEKRKDQIRAPALYAVAGTVPLWASYHQISH